MHADFVTLTSGAPPSPCTINRSIYDCTIAAIHKISSAHANTFCFPLGQKKRSTIGVQQHFWANHCIVWQMGPLNCETTQPLYGVLPFTKFCWDGKPINIVPGTKQTNFATKANPTQEKIARNQSSSRAMTRYAGRVRRSSKSHGPSRGRRFSKYHARVGSGRIGADWPDPTREVLLDPWTAALLKKAKIVLQTI